MAKKNDLIDKHHLLWQRRYWNNGYTKELRNYWYCVVDMPKDTLHPRIHESISHIPVPSGVSAREVLQSLRTLESYGIISENDCIVKRLAILIALFKFIEQPTVDALWKQLEVVRDYKNKPR